MGRHDEGILAHLTIGRAIRKIQKLRSQIGREIIIMSNCEVAAVLCHSPSFLLGLADEPLGNMMEEALKRWKPEANAKLDRAVELKALAAKYTPFVRGLGASSFNATVAAKWNNRVDA